MYLQNAIFKNVAPFGDLDLSFEKNQVIVFSGINGCGKTTILSYIADAFFELARAAGFRDIFQDDRKLYRIILPYKFKNTEYSLVYLRFIAGEKCIDYVDAFGKIAKDEYKDAVRFEDKINFETIEANLKNQAACKHISVMNDQTSARKIMESNVVTYFPAYRLEIPVWMNDEEPRQCFSTKTRFSTHLNKNIEASTLSEQIFTWILDIVLDFQVSLTTNAWSPPHYSDIYSNGIYNEINKMLKKILSNESCRFGIEKRINPRARLSIADSNDDVLVPSIFHLSSGQITLLVLFSELIKQYDTYSTHDDTFSFEKIKGIVVIDEIEKHLHIKLQKEVLPELIKLFPNLQFITSSHTPFFALGASEVLKERVRFLDLAISGKDVPLMQIEELESLYKSMLADNENYRKLCEELESEKAKSKQLRILSEGNNIEYIEKAVGLLAPEIMDKIFFCKKTQDKTGENQLQQCYQIFVKHPELGKILFVWDCDVKKFTKLPEESENAFKFRFDKNKTNEKETTGIENLFKESYFSEEYYLPKKIKKGKYAEETSKKTLNKKGFLQDMRNNGKKEDFELFKPLIDKIKSIIGQ